MTDFIDATLAFVRAHEAWAAPIVFLLAFGESLAFISLLLPATVILWGIGALVGATGISFWPIWFAAVLGGGLGDWVSYWLGVHYHREIARMWPMNRHPDLIPKGHAFFERWGVLGVFFGRFIGPMRAVVPLIAGACTMPSLQFQIANWTSAIAWGFWTLGVGTLGAGSLKQWLG